MDAFKISNKVLCDFLLDNRSASEEDILRYLIRVCNPNNNTHSLILEKLRIDGYIKRFKSKLKSALGNKETFMRRNVQWLQDDFVINVKTSVNKGGRPRNTDYMNSSSATKRRRLMSIAEQYSELEVQEAFLYILRTSGKISLANSISHLLQLEKCVTEESDSSLIPFTADEAVALIEDAKLSKYQYEHIRIEVTKRNCNILPSYKRLKNTKAECYPDSVNVTEKGAWIDLQSLMNHTGKRLIKDRNVILPSATEKKRILRLTVKWGCDGSSDQSQYKQKFQDSETNDASIFCISMVPLSLTDIATNSEIWRNPQPSATKYCRPIKFEFAKETKDKTIYEVEQIKNSIEKLEPVKIETESGVYEIHVDMKLTMVDGKVCQALTQTPSAATCYICGAQPSQMNNIVAIQSKPLKVENYDFGLSTLHAWIRLMECILHIAYRIDFKKSAGTTEKQKELMKIAKDRIGNEFRQRVGLVVDKPKHGHGSSNDGNTARRFFSDPEITAEITGVDKNLIKRFSIILQTLACTQPIDPDKFQAFSLETAQLYVDVYPWYYMPVTVHKILLHGAHVIRHFHLAIGQLSEEAAEARNKDFKRFRLFNTRKCSRILTNEDIMHKLLVSSDPYIASIRRQWPTKLKTLDSEAENLLIKQS
jgi:hypothetical protein